MPNYFSKLLIVQTRTRVIFCLSFWLVTTHNSQISTQHLSVYLNLLSLTTSLYGGWQEDAEIYIITTPTGQMGILLLVEGGGLCFKFVCVCVCECVCVCVCMCVCLEMFENVCVFVCCRMASWLPDCECLGVYNTLNQIFSWQRKHFLSFLHNLIAGHTVTHCVLYCVLCA